MLQQLQASSRRLVSLLTPLALLLLASTPSWGQFILLDEFLDDSQFSKLDGNGDPINFFSDGASSYFGLSDGMVGDFDGDPFPLGIGS